MSTNTNSLTFSYGPHSHACSLQAFRWDTFLLNESPIQNTTHQIQNSFLFAYQQISAENENRVDRFSLVNL